jgi:hypothetical protein
VGSVSSTLTSELPSTLGPRLAAGPLALTPCPCASALPVVLAAPPLPAAALLPATTPLGLAEPATTPEPLGPWLGGAVTAAACELEPAATELDAPGPCGAASGTPKEGVPVGVPEGEGDGVGVRVGVVVGVDVDVGEGVVVGVGDRVDVRVTPLVLDGVGVGVGLALGVGVGLPVGVRDDGGQALHRSSCWEHSELRLEAPFLSHSSSAGSHWRPGTALPWYPVEQ